jgi:hypothetical protein
MSDVVFKRHYPSAVAAFWWVGIRRVMHFLQCSGVPTQIGYGRVGNEMKIASGHTCIRGLRSGAVSSSTVELISPPQSGQVTRVRPRLFIQSESGLSRAGRIHSASVGYAHEDAGNSEIRVIVDVGGK